jgi:hypothetical protein
MAEPLRIFLVHGRDATAVQQVKDWFSAKAASIEVVTLADLGIPGETIPQELERVANTGDAAIILATPDDLGGLATGPTQARARQNVWLEYGWFWARLGRRRSLLLVKGDLEAPSDTSGLLYLPFRHSISEIDAQLTSFLSRISAGSGDDVTEVLRTDFDPSRRTADYQTVAASAQRDLLVAGIGMVNVRNDLTNIIGTIMARKPSLKVTFVTLDEGFVQANLPAANTIYRGGLDGDIVRFEDILRTTLTKFPLAKPRVELRKFSGFVTFVATVADAGDQGSLMTVETILPAGTFHELARPRLMLRKRISDGIYDRYWNAIKMWHDAAPVVPL